MPRGLVKVPTNNLQHYTSLNQLIKKKAQRNIFHNLRFHQACFWRPPPYGTSVFTLVLCSAFFFFTFQDTTKDFPMIYIHKWVWTLPKWCKLAPSSSVITSWPHSAIVRWYILCSVLIVLELATLIFHFNNVPYIDFFLVFISFSYLSYYSIFRPFFMFFNLVLGSHDWYLFVYFIFSPYLRLAASCSHFFFETGRVLIPLFHYTTTFFFLSLLALNLFSLSDHNWHFIK